MGFFASHNHLYSVPSDEMDVIFLVEIRIIPSILLLGNLQRYGFILLFYHLFFFYAFEQEFFFHRYFRKARQETLRLEVFLCSGIVLQDDVNIW